MRRTWLTSTTALALVLNAAAPVPGAALGTAAKAAPTEPAPLMRLAQSDTATDAVDDAQNLLEGAAGDAETAVQDAEAAAKDEADAAEEAAKTEAEAAKAAAEEGTADTEAAAEQQAEDSSAQQQAEDAANAAAQDTEAAAEPLAEDAAAVQDSATSEAEDAAAAAAQGMDTGAEPPAKDATAVDTSNSEADDAAAAVAQGIDSGAEPPAKDATAVGTANSEADDAAAAVAQGIDTGAEPPAEDGDGATGAESAGDTAAGAAQDTDAAVDTSVAPAADAETDTAAPEVAAPEVDVAPQEDAPADAVGGGVDTQTDAAATEGTADTAADNAADDLAGEEAAQGTGTAADAGLAAANDAEALPEVSAEAQAEAAAADVENAPVAAAASGEGEVVDTQESTVTEAEARASDEEFATTASGQRNAAAPAAAAPAAAAPATAAPATAAPAPAAPAVDDDDDNQLLKNLGVAAVAGLGAYAVGKMLNNGGEVVSNTGDRAVVRDPNGQYRIIKDDDTLLRQPGSNVATSTYSDGSTRTEVVAPDNSSTVTIRAADGRVLRRTRILPDGREVVLFDDTRQFDRVDVSDLKPAQAQAYDYSSADVDTLRAALSAKNEALPDRSFSLNQIRRIDAVRHLVPVIALDAINFRTGSAVIGPDEAQDLADLGKAMRAAIDDDPRQVFLIEGHTDTVGDASYNLALSDRRAESVALALTEYFDVSPANMIVQGYGESDLRVKQAGDLRANRRAAVRNITPLLAGRN